MKELHPNEFIRLNLGPKFFGIRPTQITEKIKTGEIPTPISISDSGRARGWFGRQILEWQAKREAAAAKATEAA